MSAINTWEAAKAHGGRQAKAATGSYRQLSEHFGNSNEQLELISTLRCIGSDSATPH